MNTELLKEAVGYVGWGATSSYFAIPSLGVHPYDWEALPDLIKDHLASQLIEQVDAMEGFYVVTYESYSFVMGATMFEDDCKAESSGPNRNENSILACCEFLRERHES